MFKLDIKYFAILNEHNIGVKYTSALFSLRVAATNVKAGISSS